MDRAEFVHLVRLSEQASADDSAAYRRGVAAFAALGYFWVVGCLLLAAGMLGWAGLSLARGHFRFWQAWLALGAAGLLWTSMKALWLRLEAPEGVVITRTDAPALFTALDRIRKKVKGPAIHQVLLDGDFNASISQHPRWGLFGGTVNHLTIGLPLLLGLDRQRLLAVLAHEYGHLRGDHGRFAAWIYRTRLSWAKLDHGMRHDQGVAAAATQAFLRWYFPRFTAKTFALARQDEYEADRISARLLGRDVTAAALAEIAVKSDWLARRFWPSHWAGAGGQALPQGPYGAMARQICQPLDEAFARDSLRQALRRISDVDDTHPVLRDRLEALDAAQSLPAWSARPALELLGHGGAKWIDHFDRQWCREWATGWKRHHAYLGRVRARAEALAASAGRNNANEMVELGDLQRRLGAADEAVRPHYERALQITPDHAGGLQGLARSLPAHERAARLALLARLHDNSAAHRWWAARVAVAELESPGGEFDEKALKLWRERRREAEEGERRAWEELTETPFFEATGRHDLNAFELGELQAELGRCRAVARAWLVRKHLKEFAWRRCWLLFVELPALDDEERYDLCRELERTLDLPGPVLVLWAGWSPTLQDIQANAFEPVYPVLA